MEFCHSKGNKMKDIKGFSLIEVAIVLVIFSLLIGGALAPLGSQIEESRRKATINQLDHIKESLLGFAMASGRLPCPDTDGDGIENPLNGVGGCADEEGFVPFVTLSVKSDDAWHQSIVYFVDEEFADDVDGTGCGVANAGVSFELCSTGNIAIRDAAVGGALVAQNIPVALLSRGKNWLTDRSDNERENTDGDSTLVNRIYTGAAGEEYDDLVEWVSSNTLVAQMVGAGTLGS